MEQPAQKFHPEISNPGPDAEFYWIGHATMLIRIHDRWIMTDPCFSTYLGGVVKRYVAPAIDLDHLPTMDWVIISHSHLDHLDNPSLRQLRGSRHLVAPEFAMVYLDEDNFTSAHGVSNGSVIEDDGLRVTAVGAKHFGGRWLFDNLWDGEPYHGYIIEYQDVVIYFAGDTAYEADLFTSIAQEYDVDVALIPVGPSSGRSAEWSLYRRVHLDPFDGLDAFQDSGARWMIPIHHSTFYTRGGAEMAGILQALDQVDPQVSDQVLLMKVGESAEYSDSDRSLNLQHLN